VYLGRQGTGAGSLRLAARTVGLADQLGVRTVLTNAVRYADPDQHRLADVLDAARLLRPVDRRHLDGGERWLKDPDAMAAAADRIAQAVGDDPARAVRLLAETEATGQSCTLTPADLGLGRPHFPEPSVVGAGRALDLDNPDHVSLNDQQAFEMIRASDTVGLFQLESPGQQDLVGRLQPLLSRLPDVS